MKQEGKSDPATRALHFLRELEASGEISRGPPADGGPAASQWKYVSVRRMALFLESSLKAGLSWVVFEPNGEPLWAQIRLDVGSFLQALFLQGAFQGATPDKAYFVRCDSGTTSQADIDEGIVNILVGFAPVYPAEFVIFQISQLTGNPSP